MPAVDFRSLLSVTSDEVERPKSLPDGHYLARITRQEFGLSSKKSTPFVRFFFQPIEATGDVDQDALTGIDLSVKELRREYYISPKARYMIADLCDSVLGKDNRVLDERIPELDNSDVMIAVVKNFRDDGSESGFNDVTGVVGIEK